MNRETRTFLYGVLLVLWGMLGIVVALRSDAWYWPIILLTAAFSMYRGLGRVWATVD
jgi:hypothetical protein